VATDKKKSVVKTTITQWCLDVVVAVPSQDEINDVVQYIKEHADVARLPEIAMVATFALMVRYPVTGARHFGNDELAMLSNRKIDILSNVCCLMLTEAAKITAAIEAALMPTEKPPTKKVK